MDKQNLDQIEPKNFIEEIIVADLKEGKNDARVATRFPPEPNGYLHIGHAKSICLNFGLAKKFGGTCNLRFDDTNPESESEEYVNSIIKDVKWLGFDWENRLYFASNYFEKLYEYAEELIKKGFAYVDDLTPEQVKEYRGNYNTPGKESPYRNRSVEENLDLFRKMREGKFKNGEKMLRAKIDMQSPNMNMRDPILYRILHASHHRTGDKWCIYPMYDFAHGLEDAIEGITHSICTLEFENHRPLYDWGVNNVSVPHKPRQIEFARLNLTYTVMSKRKLLELVKSKLVNGWDDPRMPTISGLRRRGFSPESIRNFSDRIGVAKRNSTVDVALLEHSLRTDLNKRAYRLMGVLDPLKVTITNFPENETEYFKAPYHPEKPEFGSREIPFTREIYIEKDDFKENPPKKWFRLAPGKEVRLRYACLLKCNEVIKNKDGEVVELKCTWDPDSRGGTSPDGRKVRGTIHWVSSKHYVNAEVRLYDRLFNVPNPLNTEEGKDFKDYINPNSLKIIAQAYLEEDFKNSDPQKYYQFERLGYFVLDPDSTSQHLIFNRSVTLRDSWAKIEKKQVQQKPQKSSKKSDKSTKTIENSSNTIDFSVFSKVELKIGEIIKAESVEGADKLLRLEVDLKEEHPRQIFSGIKKYYPDPNVLVGKKVVVASNLKPRKMKFGISEGMVLAWENGSNLGVLSIENNPPAGSSIS